MAEDKKTIETKEVNTKSLREKGYIFAVGKRKSAVARVRLYQTISNLKWGEIEIKKGDVYVNEQKIENYFKGDVFKSYYAKPFELTGTLGKFALTIRAAGGGQRSQLDAVVHGISKALSLINPENRSALKKEGLLTRDARVRERRKVGMGGKARRKKQSPKR